MTTYRSKRLRNVSQYILGRTVFRVDEEGVLHPTNAPENGVFDADTLYSLQHHPSIMPVIQSGAESDEGSKSDNDSSSSSLKSIESDVEDEVVIPPKSMSLEDFKALAEENFDEARAHARLFGVTARGAEQLVERFVAFVGVQPDIEDAVEEKSKPESDETAQIKSAEVESKEGEEAKETEEEAAADETSDSVGDALTAVVDTAESVDGADDARPVEVEGADVPSASLEIAEPVSVITSLAIEEKEKDAIEGSQKILEDDDDAGDANDTETDDTGKDDTTEGSIELDPSDDASISDDLPRGVEEDVEPVTELAPKPMDLENFKVLAEESFEAARDHGRLFGVTARSTDRLIERYEAFILSQNEGEKAAEEQPKNEETTEVEEMPTGEISSEVNDEIIAKNDNESANNSDDVIAHVEHVE